MRASFVGTLATAGTPYEKNALKVERLYTLVTSI